MWARLVDACYEEPDSVGSLAVVLGICLGAVADGVDEAGEGNGAAVGEA